MSRNLCEIDDVTGYVPAYESNERTDAKLEQLIEAESLLIASESGREIVGPEGTATRTFELTATMVRRRTIAVGDLNGLYDDVVTLLDQNGDTVKTIAADAVVPLYEGRRQPTRDWEPITELYLPRLVDDAPVLISEWQVLELLGRWGFPEVPAFIREACAKRVILRYLSDVASAGTDFAQAVGESDLNLAAMFESAQDAVDQLKTGGIVIA